MKKDAPGNKINKTFSGAFTMLEEEIKKYRKRLESFSESCNEGLDERYIKSRKGDRGYSVDYIESAYTFTALNHVFGPLGWSRETFGHEILDESKKGNSFNIIACCRMRLSIHPDGKQNGVIAFFDDIGTGKGISSDRGTAIDGAIKKAYTDGVKRCSTTLGNFFGLGLRLDKNTARKVKAIVRNKNEDLYTKKEVSVSEKFEWLSPKTYDALKKFYSSNKETLSLQLRDMILNDAIQIYKGTFRCDSEVVETTMFKILEEIGVYSQGMALPTLDQIKRFLKRIDEEVKGLAKSSLILNKKKDPVRSTTLHSKASMAMS